MKYVFALFTMIMLTFSLSAQLADQSYWTTTIATRYLPSAAVIPTDAVVDSMLNLADPADIYSFTFSYNLPGTLDNANTATAFAAVGDALYAEILSDAVNEYGLDTSLNLWGKAIIQDVRRRHSTFEPNDLPNQYKVGNDIFRVTGVFRYTKF